MSRPLVAFAGVLFVVIALAPVAMMLGRMGPSDLAGVVRPQSLDLLGRTLLLGVSATTVAVLLGAPFGFLTARTDLPGAALLRPLGILPLLLPPLFLAVAWTAMCPVRAAPAAIGVLGLNTFPIVALFTAKAFERIDARREEAAWLAGGLPAVLRMERRLALPGVLCGACLAFVFAVNDFAVPNYVSSVGPKFNVYADEIFASWQQVQETGRAVAISLPLVVLTLATLLPALALRRRGALATLGSDFQRPAPLRLGRWRFPALLFCVACVVVASVLPLGRLLWEAGGGARGFTPASLSASIGRAVELERSFVAASLQYSALAATLCVPIALVLGHALERWRFGRIFEWIVALPLAVPAILFGIGMIAVWNHDLTAAIYDSGAVITILYMGRFLVFPLLVDSGAVAAFEPRLEEAAAVAGAGPAKRLFRIVGPGIKGSLLGGWALVFVLSMRELDAAIMVPAANRTVIFKAFNRIHFARNDEVAALCLLIVFFIALPGLLWSLFARERMEVLP